ncbi:hypothetical protein PR048_022234 [Dryococelus australis]|uniref:Uncharacterized protein n=1 Tax=Dryococelus australis TaxID=614101 RepID=A0ABQ9H0Q0_9NEOP|nr:hypothetical protein PR048_022234 [Dryococelus australis]
MWESSRVMPVVGGFSRGSPVSPALAFQRCPILTSLHPHRDKIDVQQVYTEVTFATGSQLIKYPLDDSQLISDLQGNKIDYKVVCTDVQICGYQLHIGCLLSQWKAAIGPTLCRRCQTPYGPMAKGQMGGGIFGRGAGRITLCEERLREVGEGEMWPRRRQMTAGSCRPTPRRPRGRRTSGSGPASPRADSPATHSAHTHTCPRWSASPLHSTVPGTCAVQFFILLVATSLAAAHTHTHTHTHLCRATKRLIEARYPRQNCTPVQCFARRGDERVDAHVSVTPSAAPLLGPQTCKIPSTRWPPEDCCMFVSHALDEFAPVNNLQENKDRIPRYLVWGLTGAAANEQLTKARVHKGLRQTGGGLKCVKVEQPLIPLKSSCARQQDVGTSFANQRLVTYSPASSRTNRQPCIARSSQSHFNACYQSLLERTSQKKSSDTHKTPYDREKRCRERKMNTKASERVNPAAHPIAESLAKRSSQSDTGPVSRPLRAGTFRIRGTPPSSNFCIQSTRGGYCGCPCCPASIPVEHHVRAVRNVVPYEPRPLSDPSAPAAAKPLLFILALIARHDGNTARLARRSEEAISVRVIVARIVPSLLDLGRGVTTRVHPTLNSEVLRAEGRD